MVLPVLRGSVLLQHWFGENARPAADIDLECFALPAIEEDDEYSYEYDPYEGLVDYGKAMCRYAAIGSSYYRWSRAGEGVSPVEFQQVDDPPGGSSLWVYGTPGERYYAGWIFHDQNGETGQLQIDIAEAPDYEPEDIGVAEVTLLAPRDQEFRFPAYTQEAMLAAKMSWLLRGLSRQRDGETILPPAWAGEPKDLFDAHLLLTHGDCNADVFERVMAIMGTEDMLNWNSIETLYEIRTAAMSDAAFANWPEFQQQHSALISSGPAQMLHEVADRLQPLLGSFYAPDELPFLHAIDADRDESMPYLVYADWLEEHGDNTRSALLRQYAEYLSSGLTVPRGLDAACQQSPPGWLRRVLGTRRRYLELRMSLENQ